MWVYSIGTPPVPVSNPLNVTIWGNLNSPTFDGGPITPNVWTQSNLPPPVSILSAFGNWSSYILDDPSQLLRSLVIRRHE